MRTLLLALAVVCASRAVWHPTPADFSDWMAAGGSPVTGKERLPELRNKIIARVDSFARRALDDMGTTGADLEYPYFAFIPQYFGNVIPEGPTLTWSNVCFKTNTAVATTNPDGSVNITITSHGASSFLCSDSYLFATVEGIHFDTYYEGSRVLTWTLGANATTAERWDLKTKGVRVMGFLYDIVTTIECVLDTVFLFLPELTQNVSYDQALANVDFMAKYPQVIMSPRTTQSVPVDESEIQSGDFLGVIRLDGLDPMLAWAMGSTTGHTTIALRVDGELYIAESTVSDSYWPTDGIQKTPYKTWVAQAKAAGYQVVHAPLSPAMRAQFNITAAMNFFNSVEGVEYGYQNMLWGWIDTEKDNYPCLPPDYKTCLVWEHIEVVFGLADKLIPAIGDAMFIQAWNLRLGTKGLRAADIYYQASKQGIDSRVLPTIVEDDSWNYQISRYGNTTVNAPSMVCCAFVCRMWKAAGIFDSIKSQVNCGEMTNWDDYTLDIFDHDYKRPQQCVNADPNNALCQLEGEFTLNLNNYNNKKPYAHMAEKCPSLAPQYLKPSDC